MKRYLMIGRPVSTVRTPPLLERRLAALGVPALVETRDVAPDELGRFVGEVARDPATDGLLVTMPHKRAILAHLGSVSSTAALAGSVNTVKRAPGGALVGAQFDGIALVNALQARNVPLVECRVLLLGIGGAGLAIAHAIAAHGCAHLAVCDVRDGARAAAVEQLASPLVSALAPGEAARSLDFDLLVNATPLGMADGDPSPFAERQVAAARWVADIVADPRPTRLAALAKRLGTPLVTGREMVEGQIAPIAGWLLGPRLEQ